MGKNKLFRFAENATFDHVVQPAYTEVVNGDFDLKGKWNSTLFKRDAPLILELGCGKGEYTTGLAALHPEHNHIGMDIKGARIWRGARTSMEKGLSNVAFLRTHVDHIASCFAEEEVDGIWLTFSDPQVRRSRKRLTSDIFLERYRKVLRPGGRINLKTDSPLLYQFTLNQIEQHGLPLIVHSNDIYGELIQRVDPALREVLSIRTFYESMWLAEGRPIHFVSFTLEN